MTRLTATFLACGAVAQAVAQPSFRVIPLVPGLRSPGSNDVSSDGTVVAGGGNGIAPVNLVAWWADSIHTELVPPLPGYVQATLGGLSADGRVAAGTCVPIGGGPWIAFRVELGGAPQALPPLPGHEHSEAKGIDPSGTVVCGISYTNGPTGTSSPVLWLNGAPVDLNVPSPWSSGSAFDVADGGAAVVGLLKDEVTNVIAGFRWTAPSGFQILSGPAGTERCTGIRVSPDGAVITGYCKSDYPGAYEQAARWYDDGAGQILGALYGSPWSYAYGHSTGGRIVVGKYWSAVGWHAFLYSDSIGLLDLPDFFISRGLDLEGRTLSQCAAITPDGDTLVGTTQSVGPNGNTSDAWIAHVPGLGCAADCDLSGALNVRDFICFTNLFGRASRDADCNGDHALNSADFTCFLNRFAAGCP